MSDVLQFLDKRPCSALLLLDLSAVFDTVDHSILLDRIHSKFGISGKALDWFTSYLTDRAQFVSIDGHSSDSLQLDCGVPQGSVLGPVLCLLYTAPAADILRIHNMRFYLYADDTQLYLSFANDDDSSPDDAMKLLENCLADIDDWMAVNKLNLNKHKTKFLILTSKINSLSSQPSLKFGSEVIVPSPCARNIGVVFDSTLSLVTVIPSS